MTCSAARSQGEFVTVEIVEMSRRVRLSGGFVQAVWVY